MRIARRRQPAILRRLAGPRDGALDDRAARHREPRPGEERGPEVVALDLRRSRTRRRTARDRPRPRPTAARSAAGGRRSRRRPPGRGTAGPELRERELDELDAPASRPARPPTSPWNWRASTTPRSRPGLGMPVDERGPERPRAQRELEVEQRRDADAGPERREDDLGPAQDPAVRPQARTGRPRGPAAASARGSRPRRRTRPPRARSPRSARGREARVVGLLAPRPDEPLPAQEQARRATRRTMWSACASRRDGDLPDDRATRREADRRRRAARQRDPEPPRTTRTVSARRRPRRIADRRFIRNAGDPNGARTIDASQPRIDVGGEPRRVHRARGAGGPSGPRPCPRRRPRAAASRGRRRARRSRRRARGDRQRSMSRPGGSPGPYQPRSWPQIDAPQVDRRARDHQQRSRSPAAAVRRARAPSGDEGQQERDEVEREPVPPLDPALAEVGEVEQADDEDRQPGPEREAGDGWRRIANSASSRPGALKQDAGADVDRHARAGSPGRTGRGARRAPRTAPRCRVTPSVSGLTVGQRPRAARRA